MWLVGLALLRRENMEQSGRKAMIVSEQGQDFEGHLPLPASRLGGKRFISNHGKRIQLNTSFPIHIFPGDPVEEHIGATISAHINNRRPAGIIIDFHNMQLLGGVL